MNRLRRFLAPRATYDAVEPRDVDHQEADAEDRPTNGKSRAAPPFSRYEYSVFLLLGVSMLWAWYVIY